MPNTFLQQSLRPPENTKSFNIQCFSRSTMNENAITVKLRSCINAYFSQGTAPFHFRGLVRHLQKRQCSHPYWRKYTQTGYGHPEHMKNVRVRADGDVKLRCYWQELARRHHVKHGLEVVVIVHVLEYRWEFNVLAEVPSWYSSSCEEYLVSLSHKSTSVQVI